MLLWGLSHFRGFSLFTAYYVEDGFRIIRFNGFSLCRMSMPWYYLEKLTRMILLRCYYAVCAFTYPAFVALNWKSYVPSRVEVLAGRSLRDEILNPLNIKK